MKKINRHRYGNLLGYVDICMNLLMCFIALFAFTLLLVKLEESITPSKAKIASNAKILIHMTWSNESSADIDLWAKTNNPESVVGFKNKDAPNMFLDNDNLGFASHYVVLMNGSHVTTFGNVENIQIKDCTNTHVTVNVHYYSTIHHDPVGVHVELTLLDPFATISARDIVLKNVGEEITAFNFDLDEACHITNINQTQEYFVYNQVIAQPTMPSPPNSGDK